MNKKIKFILCISILFSTLSICQVFDNMNVHDDFETSNISEIWSKEKLLPNSYEIQSEVVRKGKKAIKITLKQGGQIEVEKGTELERSELMEYYKLVSKEDSNYSYSFSMFLPKNFPIIKARLVIAQWKQYYCANKEICGSNSPVIAIRYIDGKLMINIMESSKKIILFTTDKEIRNQWLDFKFKIHFSRNKDGKISAWLNDKQIISYKGKIGYTERDGYPPKSYYYFKMGLYRDTTPETMVIFIDDYRKEQLPRGSI